MIRRIGPMKIIVKGTVKNPPWTAEHSTAPVYGGYRYSAIEVRCRRAGDTITVAWIIQSQARKALSMRRRRFSTSLCRCL